MKTILHKSLIYTCLIVLLAPLITPLTANAATMEECVKIMSAEDCRSIFTNSVWYKPDNPLDCNDNNSTNSSYSSVTAGTTTDTMAEFIKAYGKSAFDIGKANGLPYIAIIAQAGIESGWGNSKLTTEANNFFGIKAGDNWKGDTWTGRTREENSNGSSYYTNAAFRKYNTPADGFQGYADFILKNPRYKKALNYPIDPVAYITELKKAKYATAGNYITVNVKVQKTVEKYISEHSELGLQAQKDVIVEGNTEPVSISTTSNSSSPQATIYLDPGHSGITKERDDEKTGIHESLYANEPEMQNVWDVANITKTNLEQLGYKVVLSKDSESGGQYNREKADEAAAENAAIGISLHTDSTFGAFEDKKELWVQKVGLWRSNKNGDKTTFSDAGIANKSQEYASLFKKTMDEAAPTKGGIEITRQKDGVYAASGKADGNIPLVQLFATTPWLYFEVGSNAKNGLTDEQKSAYSKGIVDGVQASITSSETQTTNNECNVSSNGSVKSLQDTVLLYAWPDWHDGPYPTRKLEYETAINKAIAEGRYVGGDGIPGVDCGGFVTTLLVDSGFIPEYNNGGKGASVTGGTGTLYGGGQSKWAKENMESLGSVTSTAQLLPGDVAFNTDGSHTFIFVGDIPGFNSKIASASVGAERRAPMAGKERIIGNDVVWFRKK